MAPSSKGGGWLLAGAALLLGLSVAPPNSEWGFFGHRRINRLAVYTLDAEMMPFFRDHLEYLSDHAVDPDKRRYATKYEAVRHYIDLDHWGETPYANVPRRWTDALLYQGRFLAIRDGDTVVWRVDTFHHADAERLFWTDSRVVWTDGRQRVETQLGATRNFLHQAVLPNFYEEEIVVNLDSLGAFEFLLGADGGGQGRLLFSETFSDYGILPYHLLSYHYQLQRAFEAEDADRILRLAAEMGHYVGDAHVPLHTTENYNGQLTGQTGIHGFWESRIPELFADERYDYFVGKAEYIPVPRDYYWNIVLSSHALVDSVLRTEARLRREFPADLQMCYDTRLGREVLTQCEEFAAAWAASMDGMVEERFRASIRAVGSIWYTCWVDAGQPDLTKLAPGAGDYLTRDSLTQRPPEKLTRGRLHGGPE